MKSRTPAPIQPTPPAWSPRRYATLGLGGLMAFLLVIQVVPYGRDHTNPPVISEPAWDSPQTRALFYRACADCHSNETVWPWYSNVAPISWLVVHDTAEGRGVFNVSEWGQARRNKADEAAETVQKKSMPPWFYLPTHPTANLTNAERQQLINGLVATFGGGEGGEGFTQGGDND
jgi:mono/diheme cytochrome c family protein